MEQHQETKGLFRPETNRQREARKRLEAHAQFMAQKLAEAKEQAETDARLEAWLQKQPDPSTPLEWDEWRIAKLKFQSKSKDGAIAMDYIVSKMKKCSGAYEYSTTVDNLRQQEILKPIECAELSNILLWMKDSFAMLDESMRAEQEHEWLAKQDAIREAQEIENQRLKAEEERRAAEWNALPEERKQELLRIDAIGAQVITGNLLQWTEGNCDAAYTSRYQQACRLKIQRLSDPELAEVEAVVEQALEVIWQEHKIARLEVILLEARQQRERLRAAMESAEMAAIEAQANLPEIQGADNALAASLAAAIEDARNRTGGYVYLKQWTLADGTRWLKVGITNNPSRRDAEQNVLPVPAVTLRLMETQSMEQAAAIERALHQQLAAQKVKGAGNRELFHLDDAQLAALMAAMDS
jgi:hypothetical protein